MNDTNFYNLNIAAVVPETDSAVQLIFDVPAELKEKYQFIQGQYLTLKADINGEGCTPLLLHLFRRGRRAAAGGYQKNRWRCVFHLCQ